MIKKVNESYMKKSARIVVLLILVITAAVIMMSCSKSEDETAEGTYQLFETEILLADFATGEMGSDGIMPEDIETAGTAAEDTTDITETAAGEETDRTETETNTLAADENVSSSNTDNIDQGENEIGGRSQYSKVIMVGDSRFSGMSSVSTSASCVWICRDGAGYSWLTGTADQLIEDSIEDNCAIVFNLGVNDTDSQIDYINYINGKIDGWVEKGADFYFMTVNPVDESRYSGSINNNMIEDFNNTLMSNLSDWAAFIDTYSYLVENGFATSDGLHYESSTYQDILEYCLRQLRVE